VPELETLESASAWIDRLAVEAISGAKLIDYLEQAGFAKAFGSELTSQDANDAKPTAAPSRPKRGAKRPVKRHRREK